MTSFINLLKEAAADSNVASIKMTLYRVAKNSQVVEALIDAAENGKEIKEKEDRLNELDELLADPAVSTNSAKLNEISKEQNEISERLDELMDQWEILSDQLD